MVAMSTPRLKPFQRVYADSPRPLIEQIQAQQTAWHDAMHDEDAEEELHALGPLGEAYRMLGQLDVAATHLERAVALARTLEKPAFLVSNLVRLATTYQYRNQHAEAEPLFVEALDLAKRLGVLEDYAAQHYGKSLAEQGRWDEAIALFERAIALRTPRGDAELIASSQEALDEALVRRSRQG